MFGKVFGRPPIATSPDTQKKLGEAVEQATRLSGLDENNAQVILPDNSATRLFAGKDVLVGVSNPNTGNTKFFKARNTDAKGLTVEPYTNTLDVDNDEGEVE